MSGQFSLTGSSSKLSSTAGYIHCNWPVNLLWHNSAAASISSYHNLSSYILTEVIIFCPYDKEINALVWELSFYSICYLSPALDHNKDKTEWLNTTKQISL